MGISQKLKMPFYRRYRKQDQSDNARGQRRRVGDLVDFSRGFKEWREAKYAQPQDNTDYMNDQFDQAQRTQARKIELIQDALDIIQRIRDRRDGGLCSNTASPKQQQQQQHEQQQQQQQDQQQRQQQQQQQQQQQKQQ